MGVVSSCILVSSLDLRFSSVIISLISCIGGHGIVRATLHARHVVRITWTWLGEAVKKEKTGVQLELSS